MNIIETTFPKAMTEAEYRAHPAISYSDLKDIVRCPAEWVNRDALKHGNEEQQEEYRRLALARESEAMLVGKLFEAEVCQDAAALAALREDKRLYTLGSKNVAPRLRSDFEHVANMVARWRKVAPWGDVLAAQQQVVWFGEVRGVAIKGKLDLWFPGSGIIEDIKTAADLEDEWMDETASPWWPVKSRVPWWQAARYDLQAAMYLTLAECQDIYPADYRIRAVTKQTPPDVDWLTIKDAPAVQAAREYLPALLDEAMLLRHGGKQPRACMRCDYCRGVKEIHAPRKGW